MFIDSPGLAGQLVDWFERMLDPENSWVVTLNEKGKPVWTSAHGTRTKERARGGKQKSAIRFFGMFKINNQL